MLNKLFEEGYLNFERIVLDNYKKLNISINDAAILIEFAKSYLKYDGNVYEDKLANKLNLDTNEVSNVIARFLELNILDCNYVINKGIGQTHYSLNPLFNKLETLLSSQNKTVDNTAEIISFLESKLLRSLSSSEMDKVLMWKEDNIGIEEVNKAIEKLNSANMNVTILRLEKTLYQAPKKSDSTPAKKSIKQLLDL